MAASANYATASALLGRWIGVATLPRAALRWWPGAIEFTASGIELEADAPCRIGFAGGDFVVHHNGIVLDWPGCCWLEAGDTLVITPGSWGNYGYLRFGGDVEIDRVLGSIATSSRVLLGGIDGRLLRAGDRIHLGPDREQAMLDLPRASATSDRLRVIWGIHADNFSPSTRQAFVSSAFTVASQLDRMGVRLRDDHGVFAGAGSLSLVSDAMVPGDIQILGDGTLIVLMRDHQPTGGYPRIATIVSADLDRFAQLRPGTDIAFEAITVEHAHRLVRSTP